MFDTGNTADLDLDVLTILEVFQDGTVKMVTSYFRKGTLITGLVSLVKYDLAVRFVKLWAKKRNLEPSMCVPMVHKIYLQKG